MFGLIQHKDKPELCKFTIYMFDKGRNGWDVHTEAHKARGEERAKIENKISCSTPSEAIAAARAFLDALEA